MLTAVAGGLREWIQHHHGRLGRVRVKVPVSLHHAGDGEGNRDSFFTLELPLGEPDAVAPPGRRARGDGRAQGLTTTPRRSTC